MKKWKKLVALLLCFVMAAGLLPVSALSVPAQAASDTAVTVKEAVYEEGSIDITVNSSAAYRGAKIAVACYDSGGKMTSIDMFNANLTAGDKSFNRELPEDFDTCKVYVTDNAYRPFFAAVEADEYVAPDPNQHYIHYDLANGDLYLKKLIQDGIINFPSSQSFSEEQSVTLPSQFDIAGYSFAGWYDLPSWEAGDPVKKIPMGTDEDVYVYARWKKDTYTVQFKSDVFIETNEITYTVDKGAVLQPPKQLSNYVFTGWSDETGHLCKNIPVGTTGDIVLTANWTSERNKTWTKTKLDAPIVIEDEETNTILFTYEIGEIQNVPLNVIHDFGYISGDGVPKTEKAVVTIQTDETLMKTFSKTVANATTKSSDWTLSKDWTEATSIDEGWCTEKGLTTEEAEQITKSDSNNWLVSSGKSGSLETTRMETNNDGWQNQVKINGNHEDYSYNEDQSSHFEYDDKYWNAGGKLTYTPPSVSLGVSVDGVGANIGVSGGWGGEAGLGLGHQWGTNDSSSHVDISSEYNQSGFELGSTHNHSTSTTNGSVASSSWNSSSSYGGSSTVSMSDEVRKTISELISQNYNYGKEYIGKEGSSSSQGFTTEQSSSDEYSNTVTYSKIIGSSTQQEWTTKGTKPGYHRWILAGTAHVFATVGYNMSTKSYFVNTFTVMDDETHEFEDYSYTSSNYNDHENGVISFEIPYEVTSYIADCTFFSDGLKVNQQTGVITGYNGQDTGVLIPEYMNVGSGDVVKITGISASAFAGNTNVKSIVLSNFINEIPDNAFEGCTSLGGILGGQITKIGSNAFNGCTSVEDCEVKPNLVSLGDNAFGSVSKLKATPKNDDVVRAVINSGAKSIELHLDKLENNGDELNGKALSIPDTAERFELNAYGKTFNDLTVVSNAGKTVINKANFNSSSGIPLQFTSPDVVLNQVTVHAPGIAMVMASENTNLGMQGTISVSSDNVNTLLSKNVALYESNPLVNGLLDVDGKMLVNGTVQNKELLSEDAYEEISADMFDRLLHSYTLYFDPNGGTCGEVSREVPNGTALGTLPTPTRQYYSFAGWFLADGTRVTETTVFSSGLDQTVYAHWNPIPFTVTFDAQGGSASYSSKQVTFGSAIGALPDARKDYYYFDGWFLGDGTKITENTVFNTADNRTVYAHWHEKEVKGWVKANEVPSGAQIVERKYSYTQRSYTSSSSSSMSGWTQYDTKWAWSDWGNWSGWSKSSVTSSDSREVESRQAVSSYNMISYTYTDNSSPTLRSYYPSPQNLYLRAEHNSVWPKSRLDSSTQYANGSYYNEPGLWNVAGMIHGGTAYVSPDDNYIPFFIQSTNYETQYRYRDRSKIYTYYFYRDENKESTSYPSGNDISNIVEWVKYREK